MLGWPPAAAIAADTPDAPGATAEAEQDVQLLKPEELEQIVASIALYPDPLLSQVLIASTYPLEVVMAERFMKQNKNLKGEALKTALTKQDWDDSVKSLTATPDVLATMASELEWTQKLGDAVLAQQNDVMDAVQRLRTKAMDQKTLTSSEQQKVTTETENNQQVVVIEPTQPDTVYVPYYNPSVVYGAWSYPSYPPYYYPSYYPGYVAGSALLTGLAFGTGIAIAGGIWGGGFDWGHGDVNVNINNNRTNWTHNSAHRRGVQYSNRSMQQRYARNNASRQALRSSGINDRAAFRGRQDTGALRNQRSNLQGRNAQARNAQARNTQARTNAARSSNLQQRTPASKRGDYSTARASAGGLGRTGVRSSNNAFSGIGNGNATRMQSSRGYQSLASAGGGRSAGAGRSFSGGGRSMGGGMRGGGGRGGRR